MERAQLALMFAPEQHHGPDADVWVNSIRRSVYLYPVTP